MSVHRTNLPGQKISWTTKTLQRCVTRRNSSTQQRRWTSQEAHKPSSLAEQATRRKSTLSQRYHDVADVHCSEITSALEEALLPTARDSVGARILKKMGWRPGQGVGPRVTWEQLRAQDAKSASLSSADVSKTAVAEHDEATKHTYAPRDTKLPVFTRKANNHGLGYAPGASLHESVEAASKAGPSISGMLVLRVSKFALIRYQRDSVLER